MFPDILALINFNKFNRSSDFNGFKINTMDLLNELDKLISRDNESSAGNGVIPLDVLLRKPDGNNVTSIEVGGQFVRSIPEVVAILVAYSIVIILSLFGNSLVSIST